MPEFLAETYTPRDAPALARGRAADAALAARQVRDEGVPVRLLGVIVIPDDEICFYLYRAPSAGAVDAALARAQLRPDRITQVTSIRRIRAVVLSASLSSWCPWTRAGEPGHGGCSRPWTAAGRLGGSLRVRKPTKTGQPGD